jgi:CHAT domain-containing protein
MSAPERANLAHAKQHCPDTRPQGVAAHAGPHAGLASIDTRGSLADLAQLRLLAPLPETADELCAVASDLKAERQAIRLGATATEREVKRLSASGDLAQYRIVHFATHGARAGELDRTHEPGLILHRPRAERGG